MSSQYGEEQPEKFFIPVANQLTVASGATGNAPTQAVAITMYRPVKAYMQVKFVGASTATGTITFDFVARGHELQGYPTIASFSVTVPANAVDGSNNVIADAIVNSEAYYDIKLLKVINNSSIQITGANASICYKY